MKQLLALLVAVAPLTVAARDLGAGTVEISGATNAAFTMMETDSGGPTADVDQWHVDAGAIYYAIRNVGLGVEVMHQRTETSFRGDTTLQRTTAVGPVLGLNLGLSDILSLKARAAIRYGRSDGEDAALDGFGWSIAGGASLFVHGQVSVDAVLVYGRSSLDAGERTLDTSGLAGGIGLSVYFGGT